LFINIFALVVLVIGLLYVGRYRQELLQTEFAALTVQAEMVAASVGEAAVLSEGVDEPELIPDLAASIVRRLARTSRTQAQLVNSDGMLVVDSRRVSGPGGVVEIDELPPPAG
jgi:two-component system sensor histidine kinase ChvG